MVSRQADEGSRSSMDPDGFYGSGSFMSSTTSIGSNPTTRGVEDPVESNSLRNARTAQLTNFDNRALSKSRTKNDTTADETKDCKTKRAKKKKGRYGKSSKEEPSKTGATPSYFNMGQTTNGRGNYPRIPSPNPKRRNKAARGPRARLS